MPQLTIMKSVELVLVQSLLMKSKKTIQRILAFPTAWQKLDGDIRRCLINRFPFGVIYYQRDNEIIILAIMQLQRKPNYGKRERYNKFTHNSYYFDKINVLKSRSMVYGEKIINHWGVADSAFCY